MIMNDERARQPLEAKWLNYIKENKAKLATKSNYPNGSLSK